ncbi:MAG: FkbM family methyltransferase [Parvularculaceae bacterium]
MGFSELKSRINGLLSRGGFRLVDLKAAMNVDSWNGLNLIYPLAAHYLSKRPEGIVLMQIGANDGVSGDVVRSVLALPKVQAILVEPNPVVFRKLEALYRDRPEIITANVAISDRGGTQPFYVGELPEGAPESSELTKISSFSRAHVETLVAAYNGRTEGPQARVGQINVKCASIRELMNEHGFGAIDLLAVDAEGYDYVIVKSALASGLAVPMIQFEFKNMSRAQFAEITELLAANKYIFARTGLDIFAVHEPVYKASFPEFLVAG